MMSIGRGLLRKRGGDDGKKTTFHKEIRKICG
jgi:hypothetical protein